MTADLTKLTADLATLATDVTAAADRVAAAETGGVTQAEVDALDQTVTGIDAAVVAIAPAPASPPTAVTVTP